MPSLIHCVYASAASADFTKNHLETLLVHARTKNQQLGLTGMLLFTAGSFFQVLEGEAATVEAVVTTITHDQRHTHITVITRESIVTRDFAHWSMGASLFTPADLTAIIGTNDFFGDPNCFQQLDHGRVKKLVAAFAAGRWRSHLTNGALHEVQA